MRCTSLAKKGVVNRRIGGMFRLDIDIVMIRWLVVVLFWGNRTVRWRGKICCWRKI